MERSKNATLYTDALKPASVLSLSLQEGHIDVIQGIKHILKSHSSLKKLSSQNPEEWPVTKVVLSKMKDEHSGKKYQGSELYRFNNGTFHSCKVHALADLSSLDQQMRVRLEWSGVDLMQSIIVFLDTQSWQDSEESYKDDHMSEIKSAVVSLTEVFRPSGSKGC